MKTCLIFALMLLGSSAFGHGEDKPGPHKGYIRMPGAFHTEVVPQGASQFQIYLLDMEWKNPSVKKSKVDVKVAENDRVESVECAQKRNYFLCKLPSGFSLKKGKLLVNSSRGGLPGIEVSYDLPLSFSIGGSTDSHHQHH